MPEKTPFSAGAERYIIACCLNDPDSVLEFSSKLRPEDFYITLYRYTYQVCLLLSERDMVPDPVTVYNHLDRLGVAESSTLRDLDVLSRSPFDLQNAKEYVDEIKACSVRRQLIETQQQTIKKLSEDDTLTADAAVSLSETRLLDVMDHAVPDAEVVKVGDDGLYARLKELSEAPTQLAGLPTGFPSLDASIGGMEPGRLYMVAARMKTGKSAFVTNVALNLACNYSVPVLIIDTEMPTKQAEFRMLANLSGVPKKLIRNGQFSKDSSMSDRVFDAVNTLQSSQLYHHYMPEFNFDACYGLIKKYVVKKGVGLIVFDYMKVPSVYDRNSREDQVLGYLTDAFHNRVAGALNVPVLSACQVGRRADEESKESMNQIADSDRLGRYTDVMMFLRNKSDLEKEKYGCSPERGNQVLSVQASRDSESKEYYYDIWYDGDLQRMTEVAARKC